MTFKAQSALQRTREALQQALCAMGMKDMEIRMLKNEVAILQQQLYEARSRLEEFQVDGP